jgi:hypothetical protein
MWANEKLINNGYDPISVDNMADSFRDGTKITALLQIMTGKKLKGIDWHPKDNSLVVSSNFSILWKFMKNEEMLDLGGINTLDIQKGNEKIVLALLWRYIMKYDLDADDGSAQDQLLEWVQPRTEKYYEVNNFTNSWKNGVAFLALFDSCRPGVVNMDDVDGDDQEENLARAFDLFEEHLGVSKLLEVNDLMVAKVDKKSVMCYVAMIKNAITKDEELQAQMKHDANAGHCNRGEELFAQGTAKYVQASADDESHLDDIVATAVNKLKDSSGTPEEFATIEAEAKESLLEATTRYDEASGKYMEAKVEFGLVDDGSCADRVIACDEKVKEVEKHKQELEDELKERLRKAIKNERGRKKLQDGHTQLDEAIADAGEVLEEALADAYDKIEKSRNEQQRIQAVAEAEEKVTKATNRFYEVREVYEEAEQLLVDEDLKAEAIDGEQKCLDLANQLLKTLNNKLNDAIASAGESDDLDDAELLAIYHAFSVEVDALVQNMTVEDPGVQSAKGLARSRLSGITEQLKTMREKQNSLRKVLHAALDAGIDGQGLP